MTAATLDRPAADEADPPRRPNGGGPARRAVWRWAVRLFRREWRQQVLIMALLAVAVSATTFALSAATNTSRPPTTTSTLPGSDPQLAADIAAVQSAFGPATVDAHHSARVPGSVSSLDLRSTEPGGSSTDAHVSLLGGRLPAASNEAAMTQDLANQFGIHTGDSLHTLGVDLTAVGIVENPTDLDDQFVLVAPGQLSSVDDVSVQINADVPRTSIDSFRLPSGTAAQISAESDADKTQSAIAVLVVGTLALLFVGLVSVASFSVITHRRERALGMLASMGATDSHVRMVTVANGAVVGVLAALAGACIGLAFWLAFAPRLESLAAHRIDRFDIPWWAIIAAVALAVLTSVAAAWWPARTAARASISTTLTARPPQSQPAARVAMAGITIVAAGITALAFAGEHNRFLVIPGTIATVVGVLLLGPLAIRCVAALAHRLPIAGRLAVRDLSRYQARSGAALGAATLAIGIAAIVTVSAAAQVTKAAAEGENLPADELVVYVSPDGRPGGPAHQLTDVETRAARDHVDAIARAAGTTNELELQIAVPPGSATVGGPSSGKTAGRVAVGPGAGGEPDAEPAGLVADIPQPDGGHAFKLVAPLYVATPDVLANYGITASTLDPNTDVVTSRTDLADTHLERGDGEPIAQPKLQTVDLPRDTSEPNALLTTDAVARLGLQPEPAAWIIRTATPLTAKQIDTARTSAAAAGLTIETQETHQSLTQLGTDATALGMLFALVVLAMTVGLIRSETANDLRVLTATGATSTTRRNLTAATTATLAALAALLGIATAYIALAAFFHSDLTTLTPPPVGNLVAIAIGLPVIATAAGWLLAGREPDHLATRPPT